ncbi:MULTISPECIES: methyl-accepting chemotaxis protein TlpB [Bacillus]|uniref:Methyl-accepting chemotaxis protein McpB n=18 Tax=Bacillaceae TaxID=186817 RepID=A0ABN5AI75_9BACI|nr:MULTISPECIES: methyl-accepting chemotaxis protein [Bacillus]ASB88953.1 Methyl-accepting chemotaxis protein McpB [Bacillus sonorensis]MDR4958472.1 methyl-accepting chemotaxis protein [Bacillus sonorensis]UBF30928.1 methyl-accepting chemotaxis protein [Bacillus sp. PM8313]WOV58881.1 methyl-accepting chemotaxis protein [Bacillus sp. KICET-3]WPP34643.1 methyl-accepting chemotaxis protein [Bacillus sonorensis]
MGKLWDWIKRPSISKRLIFSFLFILTIPVAVLACSSYYTAGSSLESEMMISARNSVDQLNKMIDQNVEKKADAIAYFSETIQDKTYKEKDQASVREKFAQYAKQNKDVEAVFTGSKDSIYVQYPRTKMPENYDPVERGWYQEAVAKKGEIIVTEPYKSAATGNTVITIAKQNQDGSGVAALSLNIDELIKATNDVKIGTSGFAFISSADQKYVAHPKAKAGTAGEGDWMKQMYSKDKGLFSYTFEGKEKQMVFVTNKLTGWKIGGTMVTDEITAAAQPVFNMAVIILAAAIVLGGILVYFIVRAISKPLNQLVSSAKSISNGDLTQTIEVRSKDELGQLGTSFNEMAESLRSLISAIQESVEHVASSSEQLTASADQTSKATEHITLAIEQFSNGAESQNEKVETSSQQLNQMNGKLFEVTEVSEAVTESSIKSTEIAETGGELVQKTVGQMNSINQSVKQAEGVVKGLEAKSKDITAILRVINGIADQTNLLALNAAIEAARAGESGRGFSVVAEEVRKLAAQSASSAKEIESLIQDIVKEIEHSLTMFQSVNYEVQSGLNITEDTEASFKHIYDMTNEIAGELQTMNTAVEQLSKGSEEVSEAVEEIAEVSKESSAGIQDIAASAEEQLASMEEISSSAATLEQMAEDLRNLTKKFKI